ncbi:MAG: DUF1015 domain-containing protein [Syntrophobacteraceae bacterium]
MAEIAPFRGLRYNQEIIPDLAEVVIPPYDVISPEEQAAFHNRNPYNMIRLELGASNPGDTAENNAHSRAAAFMKQWEHQRILVRNPKPTIYHYELDYANGHGPRMTRKGFICVLRLEEFSRGGVRPHEKTFQAIKDERLSLMLASNANLSPVFALYSDPGETVQAALASGAKAPPAISFTDHANRTHRVWLVTEREVLNEVRKLMEDKAIFIADGHHRYETALNFRNVMRARHGSDNPEATCEYIMMYLSDMDQGGLTILPTHRLLRNLGKWGLGEFMERSAALFDVQRFESANGCELKWKSAIEAGGGREDITIGFYCEEAGCVYVLTAKRNEVSSRLEQKGIPAPLRSLDVVVLDQIVLRDLLGLSDEFLGSEHNISFMHNFSEALGAVKSGKFDAGFFINPTRIGQVRDVATAGLIMPHKSTYFYPKVISGLVINPLSPNEDITW